MTLKEVQQYLDIPRTCMYELVRQGRLPARKVKSAWYIDWQKLQRWICNEIKRKDLVNNGTEKI